MGSKRKIAFLTSKFFLICIFSQKPDDLALDFDMGRKNGGHSSICWHKLDTIFLKINTLQRRTSVGKERYHDIAVLGILLMLNNDEIPVHNAVINHGFPFDLQNVVCLAGRYHVRSDPHIIVRVSIRL